MTVVRPAGDRLVDGRPEATAYATASEAANNFRELAREVIALG